jgi:hypothetical protein
MQQALDAYNKAIVNRFILEFFFLNVTIKKKRRLTVVLAYIFQTGHDVSKFLKDFKK